MSFCRSWSSSSFASFALAAVIGAVAPPPTAFLSTSEPLPSPRLAGAQSGAARSDTARSDTSRASRPKAVDSTQADATQADSASDLPDVRLHGFLSRKASRRHGYFFELAALRDQRSPRLSDVVRDVPGLRVVTSQTGLSQVRIRGCRPLVWFDGVRNLHSELDETASANDVAAVEVYVSLDAVPAEYRDYRVPCGAILLWSRS